MFDNVKQISAVKQLLQDFQLMQTKRIPWSSHMVGTNIMTQYLLLTIFQIKKLKHTWGDGINNS